MESAVPDTDGRAEVPDLITFGISNLGAQINVEECGGETNVLNLNYKLIAVARCVSNRKIVT